ncbi:hypothetical protein BRADI_4g42276v3 [Brachypodium distachyon]|uniref:Uncharacterized protein n=1 Tax=Brachypodium distachyon TaxID=15368 RepID=A0A0Q3LHZ9_BRADI|nr:hypothetical protein BRADI_4g42276v3 [Brachypodium distachyon]
MAMAAAAFLPGLLPTPPRSAMITPCIVILPPPASNRKHPNPGRADSAERWDAHKNRPRSPASSSCGSTSPARADSCQRWDINKKKKVIPGSNSSSRSGSASPSSMSISGDSRASSADRWDAHKKPTARDAVSDAESRTGDQAQAQQMSEEEEEEEEDETMLMEMEETAAPWFVDRRVLFSGPSFFVASPEPSMLPMPTFLSRRAAGKIHDLPSMSILQLH